MSGELTPQEMAGRAIADLDQGVSDPARRYDAVGALFEGLAAAAAQISADKRARKEAARQARLNDPVARARRSAAAKKAAATRAAKKAAERAAWAAEEERDARVPAVPCPHIDFTPFGEVRCVGEPAHEGVHEDLDGHTWPNECDEDCGEICGY